MAILTNMLAVHLENARVEVHDQPRPHRPGLRPDAPALRRHLQYRPRTPARLLRLHRHARPRVCRRSGRGGFARLVGHRVVGEINLACGALRLVPARPGPPLPARTVLGIVNHPGAFREFLTLPERNLHALPDALPTERAVFTEPLAAACEILDQVTMPLQRRSRGAGRRQARTAHRAGAECLRPPRAPVRPPSRKSCKSPAAPASPPKSPARRLPEMAYDWVVDATGSPEGLRPSRADDAPARHRDSEIHRARPGGSGYRARDRQRDHAGRLALRAVRTGARSAQPQPDPGRRDDLGASSGSPTPRAPSSAPRRKAC